MLYTIDDDLTTDFDIVNRYIVGWTTRPFFELLSRDLLIDVKLFLMCSW